MARRLRSPRDLIHIDGLRTLHRTRYGASPIPVWCSTSTAMPRTPDHRRSRCRPPWRASRPSSRRSAPGTCAGARPIGRGVGGGGVRARRVRPDRRRRGVDRPLGRTGHRCPHVDGEEVGADIVVADVDAHHLYCDLVPNARSLRRLARAGPSSSGFALLIAVEGRTPGWPTTTCRSPSTIGGVRRSVHRAPAGGRSRGVRLLLGGHRCGSGPAGCENWFVLVNSAVRRLDGLDNRGSPLPGPSGRSAGRPGLGPVRPDAVRGDHHARRHRPSLSAHSGAIYGTSSNGGPRRSSVPATGSVGRSVPRRRIEPPGGGLPSSRISARGDLVAATRGGRTHDRPRRAA